MRISILEEGAPAYSEDPRLRDGVRVHVSMPCPLKVPFKQFFAPFVEKYNAERPDKPVSCSDLTDCASQDIEFLLRARREEGDFPDVIVTNNYSVFFTHGFSDRFLKTGVYTGLTRPDDLDALPEKIRAGVLRSGIGILCFMSWSVVQDLTVPDVPAVDSWAELLDSGLGLTVHGHVDKAPFGLMYFLRERFGDEGIVRFAKSVVDIKHFSQTIKRFGSGDPHRTAYSLLPDVAVARIPSHKKVRVPAMKEGRLLNPVMMVARTSRLEECRPVIDQFWNDEFRALLRGGCILPGDLDDATSYSLADFGELETGLGRMEADFARLYLDNLDFGKINERATPGGVCR